MSAGVVGDAVSSVHCPGCGRELVFIDRFAQKWEITAYAVSRCDCQSGSASASDHGLCIIIC